MIRRISALLLLVSMSTACVSVRQVETKPLAGSGGGVSLRVYEKDDDVRDDRLAPPGVVSLLERANGARWETAFRSFEPRWTVVGLAAGRYRVRISSRLDEYGNEVALDNRPREIRVKSGELSEVRVVLNHVSTGWVVAGAVTALVGVVLLHEWLKDHDLPLPPLPPPPPPWLADVAVSVAIDLSPPGPPMPDAPRPPSIRVSSHFPESNALVAAKRIRVLFTLVDSRSNPAVVPRLSIRVTGARAGEIPGATRYDARKAWLEWNPDEDLPRNDEFRVELAQDGGPPLAGFAFKTAR